MNISNIFFVSDLFNIILFLIIINFIEIISQDFQTITPSILSTDSSLLEIKNNENKNIIITTKEIFTGLEPQKIGNLENEFQSITDFTTYDSTYMLAVCTRNHLFIQFNINSLEKKILYEYSDFEFLLTSSTCSVCYFDPYAYITYTYINYNDNLVTYYFIRINLVASENGPILGDSFKLYSFQIGLVTPSDFKLISCEAIQLLNDNTASHIICGLIFVLYPNLYSYIVFSINYEEGNYFYGILYNSERLINYKIQRINSIYVRYLIEGFSFELYLSYDNSGYHLNLVSDEFKNIYLSSFNSYNGLFYYNNEYIFHATPNNEINSNYNLYISNSISNNNLITISLNKQVEKVQGFYDQTSDKFIYVYQYSNKIEYFILQYKCFSNAWYIKDDNSVFCYDNQNHCESNTYYYHTDTRECVKSHCRNNYFQFNFECYKSNCPENTELIPSSDNLCESTLDYCYIDNSYKTHCSNIQFDEYTQRYENTKIYLNNCGDSVYLFNVNTYWYQNVCLSNCPSQTNSNSDSGKCECIYYKNYLDSDRIIYECLQETENCNDYNKYSIISIKECVDTEQECINGNYKILNKLCFTNCPENTIEVGDYCKCQFHFYINENGLNCFPEEKSCEDIGYPIKSNTNECFLTKEICIEKGNKLFNNICYINLCPENTYEKDANSICYCSYLYYYDSVNDLYTCFAENESCQSKGYDYQNMDTTECFISLEECKNRGSKIFNKKCYYSCPENTIINDNDESICICKNYYFYDEEQDLYNCFDDDTICITANIEYQYTNIESKECFKTKEDCEIKSPKEKCKYFDSCEPDKDYMFNNVCYKNNCPQGTILDSTNTSSRLCICEQNSEIDPITGLITCTKTLPEQYYSNEEKCPYIYNNSCVLECPENTCLNPNMKELVECFDATESMKIVNGICIEGIKELLNKIIISDDNYTNMQPIQTPSGTTVNTFSSEMSIDTLIKQFPDLTYIDLGDCEEKLKIQYNLSLDTKLYILGIDSPNLKGNSSINAFDYEIYLKNGTQIKDLSACNDTKIITSSNINDLDAVNFDDGKKFSDNGYDIYNKSNKFYVDNCAPANDNGNDIILKDRATYYYPSVDICNEGCDYKNIDYDTKRFICECDVYISNSNNTKDKENKEKDQTYLEFFLSFINYKIIKCYTLFYHFESFYYNGGFYIGFITFFLSIILIFVFCFKTVNTIRIDFFKNFPTKEKLKAIYRSYMKKRTINNRKNNNSKIINSCNPPHKHRNHSTINLMFFGINNKRKGIEDEKLKKIDKIHNNENNSNILNNNINKNNSNKIKGEQKQDSKTIRNNSNLIIKNVANKDINNQKDKKLDNTSNIKLKSPPEIYKLNKNKRNSIKAYSPNNKRSSSKLYINNSNAQIKQTINNNSIEANEKLVIDFNFEHLIDIRDEKVEKDELNEIPYRQALRIDKRNFFEIALTVLVNKVGILNLLFYRNRYSYLSLNINVYLFELLLDLTLNCFLYSEDVVSEKYHNNGSLSMFTSLYVSILSNVASAIIISIVSNLTNYSEILEAIILNVKNRKKYLQNIVRFLKYIRIRLSFFHLLQLTFILLMTYYLFIFCTVYHNSQGSIVINYIIGALSSLGYSVGLTIIITVLRVISLKYHSYQLFNASRYLYKTF